MEPGPGADGEEELVQSAEEKNWRGICIALLVICTICSLIITSIVLLSPGDEGPRVKHPRMQLEEFVSGLFQPKDFEGAWISDKELLYRNSEGALVILDASKLTERVLITNSTFRQFHITHYSLSTDKEYVLLVHGVQKTYKYTYTAKYKIFNVSNEHLFPLEPPGEDKDLQYASWGPLANQLVYVYKNNIYYVPHVGEKATPVISTGEEGVIFNGVPDWLYEEEILQKESAIWWSPDGSKLCFASFDDSKVDVLTYPWYGSYEDPGNIYPELRTLRYPKAGRENPTVSLWVVELNPSGSVSTPKQVMPPADILGRDHYLTAVTWIDRTRLIVIWMQRAQNYSVLTLCTAEREWNCERHLDETTNGKGWVDMYEPPLISADRRHYFLRLPIAEGKAGQFKHVAMVSLHGRVKNFLTQGHYDVTQILAHRQETRTVYYVATLPNKPGERHIFGISDVVSKKPRNITCLTCEIGDDCLYNNAIFSPGGKYYVLRCLGPAIPRMELRSVDGNNVLILENNDELRELAGNRAMPESRTFTVATDGGSRAQVRLLLPPVMREHEEIKYPLVVQVNGRPGSQTVSKKYEITWGDYIAGTQDFIYATIDGRGSGFQGDKVLHEVYHRLGTVEVEDQLTIINYLKTELPFVDPVNIALWGWSYGGYVTGNAIAEDDDNVKCAMAVAPITNWLFYHSTAAERYLGLPWSQGSFIRYDNANLIKKAAKIKDKKFFLLHGTADESVHIQHSFMLMKALTEAGVVYRSQVYPDANHELDGAHLHQYRSMEEYLKECFDIVEQEEESAPSEASR